MSYRPRQAGVDQDVAAEEMLARVAAAFVAGVPVQPEDDGFFEPCSLTWRLTGDVSGLVAGMRSLLMQALHPLAMALRYRGGWSGH